MGIFIRLLLAIEFLVISIVMGFLFYNFGKAGQSLELSICIIGYIIFIAIWRLRII